MKVSSNEGSLAFGTFSNVSATALFASAKALRNQTITSSGMLTHGTCSPPCSRLPSEDERPNSFYLLVPDRFGVWLLRQLVQCEPDRTLNGGTRLLLRLPFGDCKLVLQLLQKFPRHLLHRRVLGLGQLRFWLSKQIEYGQFVFGETLSRRAAFLLLHRGDERLEGFKEGFHAKCA